MVSTSYEISIVGFSASVTSSIMMILSVSDLLALGQKTLASFRCSNMSLYGDEAVGGHRNGVDAAVHKESGKFRMVTWRLTAKADLGSVAMCLFDHMPDHPFHGFVLLIELLGKQFGIAIDAECQLRQVIAADRKAVEPFRESCGLDHVRRNFAHHVDFQAVGTALQPVLCHYRQDLVGLLH